MRVAALVLVAAGCLSDRPRPAPPQLTIVLSSLTVRSPDTLRGNLHAEDSDGIDSVWLSIDGGPPKGSDGLLKAVFDAPFKAPIGGGHSAGERIQVKLQARDVAGFRGELDTSVTVIP